MLAGSDARSSDGREIRGDPLRRSIRHGAGSFLDQTDLNSHPCCNVQRIHRCGQELAAVLAGAWLRLGGGLSPRIDDLSPAPC